MSLRPAGLQVVIAIAVMLAAISARGADVSICIDADSAIRRIPETLYGANLMAWDGRQDGSNANFNNLMIASGRKYMRWPGGSWGDAYLWSDMEYPPGWQNDWIVSYSETLYLLGQIGGTMQPIVNFPGYWYDTLHGHAAAVTAAIAWLQDQTARTPWAQYWEIGNEIMGPWEAGWFEGMCGTYYGTQFVDFYNAMKDVNPNVKIGAVADPYDRPDWWNPGLWTRDMLTAMEANGVVPDFLIVHSYPASGRRGDYNPTLLGEMVDEIEQFTNNLKYIISDSIGPEHVGQIEFWMTEFRSGGISADDDPNNPYERWKMYVSGMFTAQYLMEMARHGWQGANSWGQWEFYDDWRVFPDWYVYPFLINRFGRNIVETNTASQSIRAYAAKDDANNLTVFIINNSADTNMTARLDIAGTGVATTGQKWLMEPDGTIPSGGTVQEANDIRINGVFHPNPLTVNSLAGQSFVAGDSFDVNLPRSCMLFIKMALLPGGQRPYPGEHSVPGVIESEDYDTGGEGVAYHDTTPVNSGGACRSEDVDIELCSEGGCNVTGIEAGEWLEYLVDVKSAGLHRIEVRVASADAGGSFHIESGGVDVTGGVSFAATGGGQSWTNVAASNVLLRAGKQVMRLSMDSGGWNVNRMTITRTGGGSGSILREWWTGIPGTAVNALRADPNYPNNPAGRGLINRLEAPMNWADNYGTRIRGYVEPLMSGSYRFWIASDDASELRLSADEDPAHSVPIAYVPGWTNSREWTNYPQQQSALIPLVAGQRYYIDVLHKEGGSSDNVAVAWEGPGFERQVIDGEFLSPCCIKMSDFAKFAGQWQRDDCFSWNGWCLTADHDRDGSVTLSDLERLSEDWLAALPI